MGATCMINILLKSHMCIYFECSQFSHRQSCGALTRHTRESLQWNINTSHTFRCFAVSRFPFEKLTQIIGYIWAVCIHYAYAHYSTSFGIADTAHTCTTSAFTHSHVSNTNETHTHIRSIDVSHTSEKKAN